MPPPPIPSPPSATVVIPTVGRAASLEACLRAVDAQRPAPAQVIVVESGGSTPAVAEAAARLGAAYLAEPRPGACRARNRGARAAAGEVVAFTDDDAVPQPGWLAALVAEFRDPAVAAVAGRVRPGRGLRGEALEIASRIGLARSGGAVRRVVSRATPGWFEITNFGGIGIGPNMAFRRAAFPGWGGFDERLGPGTPLRGTEEPHAFFSLVARGHAVVYTPDALVLHPEPAPDLAQLRDRERHAYATAAGYAVFLLLTERGYRRTTAGYIAEGLAHKRREWRWAAADGRSPRGVRLLGYLSGVGLGLRTSLRRVDPYFKPG